MQRYVHGYSEREARRLVDQTDSVRDLIHADTTFDPGARVLEPGCGTGAQTAPLALRFPESSFVSFDLSESSLQRARSSVAALSNVSLLRADLFEPPFDDECFDAALVRYLLEHLPDPIRALKTVRHLLRTGAVIHVVEGDHGS